MTDDSTTPTDPTPEDGNGEWKIIHDPEGMMKSALAAMYEPMQEFLKMFDDWEDEEINSETLPAPLSDMYVIRFLAESLANKIGSIEGLILTADDLPADDDSGEDDISPIGNI